MPMKDILLELMQKRAELIGRKMVDNLPLPLPSMVSQGFSYGESTTEPPLGEDEEPIIITSVNE